MMLHIRLLLRAGRSVCWVLAVAAVWPEVGYTADTKPKINVFRIEPGFEQDSDGLSVRYRWHKGGATATLGAGGDLAIRTESGEEARISFSGTNMLSKPERGTPRRKEKRTIT